MRSSNTSGRFRSAAAIGRPAAWPAGGRSREAGPDPRSGRPALPECRAGAAAPSPRSTLPAVGSTRNSSARRMPRGLVRREVHAEDAPDLRHLQFDDLRRRRGRVDVHDAPADRRRRRTDASDPRPARPPAAPVSGWMPWLKRTLASLGRLSACIVRRMLTKSKLADSSRTFVVAADTSVSAPPMTPARAIGPGVVGDDQHVRRQLAVLRRRASSAFRRRGPGAR